MSEESLRISVETPIPQWLMSSLEARACRIAGFNVDPVPGHTVDTYIVRREPEVATGGPPEIDEPEALAYELRTTFGKAPRHNWPMALLEMLRESLNEEDPEDILGDVYPEELPYAIEDVMQSLLTKPENVGSQALPYIDIVGTYWCHAGRIGQSGGWVIRVYPNRMVSTATPSAAVDALAADLLIEAFHGDPTGTAGFDRALLDRAVQVAVSRDPDLAEAA